MMKTKILILLITSMAVSILTGCKTTEQKAKAEALKEIKEEFGDELTDEEANMMAEYYAEEAVYQEQKEAEEKQEEKSISEMKIYSASPDWANYTYSDRAIQIDDMILVPGCKVSDILEALDKSENTYIIDAEIGRLTPYNSKEDVKVYKNDVEWFHFTATNIMTPNESIPLSDCMAVAIHPDLDTYQYCGAIGLMPSDVSKMDYNDIKAYLNDYFDMDEYSISEESTTVNGIPAIALEVKAKDGSIVYNNTEWSGMQVKTGDLAAVYVDANTGKGLYAIRTIGAAYSWDKAQRSMIKSLDELDEANKEKIIDEAQNECITDNKGNVVDMVYTGTSGYVEHGANFLAPKGGLVLIFHYTLDDGKEGYMSALVSELYCNPTTKEVTHDTIWTHSYKTEEEIVEKFD